MCACVCVCVCVCVCDAPLASLAEVQCGLFLDTLSDVNRGAQTRHTRVGRVGLYGSATLTAESVVRGENQVSR